MIFRSALALIAALSFSISAMADESYEGMGEESLQSEQYSNAEELSELNPFDPNVEAMLEEFDQVYELETGLPAFLEPESGLSFRRGCYRASCKVWVNISKSQQKLDLYINGQYQRSWAVSTGMPGYGTPNFDQHPNGRIYNRYSSNKFPGGDYNGLGNMPYAVFIRGGFALHGTPKGNWSKLGRRASHGCIRQHPDNARHFNRLVRAHGISQVWITVR
jgi:hypothetical protein